MNRSTDYYPDDDEVNEEVDDVFLEDNEDNRNMVRGLISQATDWENNLLDEARGLAGLPDEPVASLSAESVASVPAEAVADNPAVQNVSENQTWDWGALRAELDQVQWRLDNLESRYERSLRNLEEMIRRENASLNRGDWLEAHRSDLNDHRLKYFPQYRDVYSPSLGSTPDVDFSMPAVPLKGGHGEHRANRHVHQAQPSAPSDDEGFVYRRRVSQSSLEWKLHYCLCTEEKATSTVDDGVVEQHLYFRVGEDLDEHPESVTEVAKSLLDKPASVLPYSLKTLSNLVIHEDEFRVPHNIATYLDRTMFSLTPFVFPANESNIGRNNSVLLSSLTSLEQAIRGLKIRGLLLREQRMEKQNRSPIVRINTPIDRDNWAEYINRVTICYHQSRHFNQNYVFILSDCVLVMIGTTGAEPVEADSNRGVNLANGASYAFFNLPNVSWSFLAGYAEQFLRWLATGILTNPPRE